jgi:hypothetical protein
VTSFWIGNHFPREVIIDVSKGGQNDLNHKDYIDSLQRFRTMRRTLGIIFAVSSSQIPLDYLAQFEIGVIQENPCASRS